jgi:hypothetical protein
MSSIDPDLVRLLKRLKLGPLLPTLPERLHRFFGSTAAIRTSSWNGSLAAYHAPRNNRTTQSS